MESEFSRLVNALPGLVWTALPGADDLPLIRGDRVQLISRSIIENRHGRLWATPNDGPGATFSFSISCTSEDLKGIHSLGAIPTPAVIDAAQVMRKS